MPRPERPRFQKVHVPQAFCCHGTRDSGRTTTPATMAALQAEDRTFGETTNAAVPRKEAVGTASALCLVSPGLQGMEPGLEPGMEPGMELGGPQGGASPAGDAQEGAQLSKPRSPTSTQQFKENKCILSHLV